jgi:hypothetical protein
VAHGSTQGSLTEGAWLTLRALAALLLAIGFYVAALTLVGVLLFMAGTGLFYGKLLFLKVALFLLAAAGATRRTRGQKIACPQCGIKQRLPE